jgi:predicted N-acyltransferase
MSVDGSPPRTGSLREQALADPTAATADESSLELRVHRAIAEIPREEWDALVGAAPDGPSERRATPFVGWRWLEALEHSGCVAARAGWRPRHLAVYRSTAGGRRLVAAAPAYVRDNSDGDFSRDFGWADGAERAGLRYYPKLCITVPITPATGRRFLVGRGEARAPLIAALVAAARELMREERLSTVQVLFPDAEEASELEALGLAKRLSHQFQWRNDGYATFDEFLGRFSSKRRNQIRREMAAPEAQGLALRTVRGDELAGDRQAWARTVHSFHRSTVDKLPWGRRWINVGFYERIFATMVEDLEVVVASRRGDARPLHEALVGGAFNVVSATRLYGRYWGCHEEHPFLHFNVCLYHSVAECIRRGIEAFEGGAGGEHKLWRGFEPSETFSSHLFADPRLDEAVRRHLAQENRDVVASLARWRAEAPILRHAARGAASGEAT